VQQAAWQAWRSREKALPYLSGMLPSGQQGHDELTRRQLHTGASEPHCALPPALPPALFAALGAGLRRLSLRGSPVCDAHCAAIAAACPALRYCDVGAASAAHSPVAVTDAGAQELLRALGALQFLGLCGASVTVTGLCAALAARAAALGQPVRREAGLAGLSPGLLLDLRGCPLLPRILRLFRGDDAGAGAGGQLERGADWAWRRVAVGSRWRSPGAAGEQCALVVGDR